MFLRSFLSAKFGNNFSEVAKRNEAKWKHSLDSGFGNRHSRRLE